MKDKRITYEISDGFEAFYKEHLNAVVRHVYRKVQDKNIAEDVAQETFYLALMKWEQVQKAEVPLRWLYQTANYKLQELQRKAITHPTVPLEEVGEMPVSEDVSHEMSELELVAKESLTEEEWELLKRYHIIGYTVEELADELGITPNNMRVRISRVTGKLRKNMEK
ncbi:MAG: sigma-70 family RNA polymerase sigma factor [Lachnospiraceae bacterium]|nr:sigma-70 family RNA polymerase sigma factor [Lachnospiraceae bacterium]